MGLPMDWTFVKDFKRYTFNYVRDLERYCLMHLQAASNLERDYGDTREGKKFGVIMAWILYKRMWSIVMGNHKPNSWHDGNYWRCVPQIRADVLETMERVASYLDPKIGEEEDEEMKIAWRCDFLKLQELKCSSNQWKTAARWAKEERVGLSWKVRNWTTASDFGIEMLIKQRWQRKEEIERINVKRRKLDQIFEDEEDGVAKDGEVDGVIEIESDGEEEIDEEGEVLAAGTVGDGEEATEELELFGAVGKDELGAGKVEDDEEVIDELKHFVSLNEEFKQCEQVGVEEVEGTGVDDVRPEDEGGDRADEDEGGDRADEEEEDGEDCAGGGRRQEAGRDGDGGRGLGEDQEDGEVQDERVGEGPSEREGVEVKDGGGMARGELGMDVGRVNEGSGVKGDGPGTGTGLKGRIGQSDQMYRVRHDFKTAEQLYRYLSKFGKIAELGHCDGTEFGDYQNIPSDALVTYYGQAFKIIDDNCPWVGITKMDEQQTWALTMTDTAEFENITGTDDRPRRWGLCDEDNLTDMLNSVGRGTKVTVWMKNRLRPFRAMWFTGQIDKVGDGCICLDYVREFRVDGVHRSVTSAYERIEFKRIYLSSILKITIDRF